MGGMGANNKEHTCDVNDDEILKAEPTLLVIDDEPRLSFSEKK